MKNIFLTIICGLIMVACTANPAEQLATRILGDKASQISFATFREGKDSLGHFRLEQKGKKVLITGDCPVSQAVGLNYYMKNYLGVEYPWVRTEITIPDQFPPVTEPVEKRANVGERFFLNYCTFGYTLPWYQWEDWQWLIDWMALNGVNMPLAITGQEAVWLEVWKEMGLTEDEVRAYFCGPAHLPWHRMGEIDGWQGPLPMSWLKGQEELQKQILKREREFGMTPILPAFAGHVPGRLMELYPDAKITRINSWMGFPGPYFLDPNDPLFSKVQNLYLSTQEKMFGTDHYYGVDPFNEMDPPSWEPEYLAGVTKNIYKSLEQVDPDAKWIEMAWIYLDKRWKQDKIKACMDVLPQGRITMLDYMAEGVETWRMTDSHYGQPFIWCYLGNFGGTCQLEGNICEVEKRLKNLFTEPSTCAGVGSTLEGFSVSRHAFEYLFDHVWNKTLEPHDWIRQWSRLHRSVPDKECEEAWVTLIDSVFVHQAGDYYGTSLNHSPSLNTNNYSQVYYDNDVLIRCSRILLAHPDDAPLSRYDIVSLSSQILCNLYTRLTDEFSRAMLAGNLPRMKELVSAAQQITGDMDRILLTLKDFLFGVWIAKARSFATSPEEGDYLEKNARTILTRWGVGYGLNDYARRILHGLVGDYYAGRWQIFFDAAIAEVESTGRPVNTDSFCSWDSEHNQRLREAADWIMEDKTVYPSEPEGDSYEVARDIDAHIDG